MTDVAQIRVAMVREDGSIAKIFLGPNNGVIEMNTPLDCTPHICGGDVLPETHVMIDGAIVPKPVTPISLADAKIQRWSDLKAQRDTAEWWGCASPLGRVDTDPDSQRKVSGAVQLAMIAQSQGQPFSIDWTMQDNSSVPHSASAMILMGVAVGTHVAACHEIALGKRTAIEGAADAAALAAIDIESGWPDSI